MIQCPKCSAENSDDSRFCKSCAEPMSSLSQAPTVAAPGGESPQAPLGTPHVARIVSSDSVPAGGFTPGTVLADRYRIIGLLGRGGMGEVYRADDLKLGQPVALKFLPPKLADDAVRRERFFAEVRITRQLSHPNICRVYDIGEVDGRHFLSMEYIDGEDLASLMKRIGHLSNEKALDIARQLVAGLTVAHERGVLHRDLKPANIMLDGHGRVRITDFGLAIAVGDEAQAEEVAGTPAYMAPEQLAGKGATVRSDIYSLGLILYEIYTGKKAFKAQTLAELREQKETLTPRAPSEIREGIDPVVERVIQRCMEKDPNARPASVAQLAQALPGGDPLAAAIAAGETPSPEMVAASGGKEGLRPALAWPILAFIILGALAMMARNDRFMLHKQIPFEKSPDALAERARDFLENAGYPKDFADSNYGFQANADLVDYLADSNKTADTWKNLNSEAILFRYRQSPRPIERNIFPNNNYYNPPLQFPGEVLVELDTEGRLVALLWVPPADIAPPAETQTEPDWETYFAEAGLKITEWVKTDPKSNPPFFADTQIAWKGTLPNWPGTTSRIEAASYRGKAVSFEVMAPWYKPPQESPEPVKVGVRIGVVLILIVLVGIVIGLIYFALKNLRLGRGDRRNATRLALFAIGLIIISWLLGTHHVPSSWEGALFFLNLCVSLAAAGFLWITYIAIEPFVRRRWPKVLVSWTRLLSGGWRDPLVARDALIGCAFGVLAYCSGSIASILIQHWFGRTQLMGRPRTINFTVLSGSNYFISAILDLVLNATIDVLILIGMLFLLRVILRNQKLVFAVAIVFMAFLDGGFIDFWAFIPGLILFYPLWFFVLMRFGLIAGIFFMFSGHIFLRFPVGFDALSTWYASFGYTALAIFAAIVLYSFRTSLGGRPLFGTPRLDEFSQ